MFKEIFKEMGESGEKCLTPLVAWVSIVNEGQVDLKKSIYYIHYRHHTITSALHIRTRLPLSC